MSDQSFKKEQHPSVKELLKYFEFAHLPPHLQSISEPICVLANIMASEDLHGPELTVGLRKLLEAKDCFVRAAIK
jgi:hypothetical protein